MAQVTRGQLWEVTGITAKAGKGPESPRAPHHHHLAFCPSFQVQQAQFTHWWTP